MAVPIQPIMAAPMALVVVARAMSVVSGASV